MVVLDGDGNGGVIKGSIDVVNGDGVVGVGGIARDIDDYAELAACLGEKLVVNEGRDRLAEVDLDSGQLKHRQVKVGEILTALRKISFWALISS